MRNLQAKLLLIFAIFLVILGALLAWHWINLRLMNQPKQVLVSVKNLPKGSKLTIQDLKLMDMPASEVPKTAFQDVRALEGRVLAQNVAINTPITENKLSTGMTGGMASIVEPGMRAMTVRVNDVVGVAGFALPGNYVDVIVNTAGPQQQTAQLPNQLSSTSISKIVLQRVLVLAVAQEDSRDATQPKVVDAVTLQVSPEQAEKIDLARSVGTLSLVLRNQSDQADTKTEGITKEELLGLAQASAPTVAKPVVAHKAVRRQKANCTEVIEGTSTKQECW